MCINTNYECLFTYLIFMYVQLVKEPELAEKSELLV